MKSNKAIELLAKMTLEEKIDQLMQLATPFFKGASDNGKITGPMVHLKVDVKNVQNAGSVLGASGAENIISIQKKHLEENRLGIPLLFMSDVVHGYKTIFPIPLAIGCSWNIDLAEQSAKIAAKEAAVSGIHVTFAPMVDLVRDPRWGRVMESTGEDPFLNSMFAKAQVKGFQGKDLKTNLDHIAACVKHFAGYGAAEGGRDYNTVNMSDRELHENYLPPFKNAINAGVKMIMSSFNIVDGIPATANKYLMRNILREQWGFDGVIISDWGAVKELISHGVASNEREAALKALEAGTDIEMMTHCYTENLKNLVESGELDESLIDEAVIRILQLKDDLGLFENPYRGADIKREQKVVMSNSHRKAARELAAESCVLLKNEKNVLPLEPMQKIALIGPFVDSGDILGQWSWLGSTDDAVTIAAGLSKKVKKNEVLISKGSDITMITEDLKKQAVETAKLADVIVMAVGEHSSMSGEAGSRSNIQLPEAQLELLKAISTVGKPIVTVLFNGRPLDLHGVIEHSDALLEAWYPGTEGGNAIGDILFGDQNPSGKLTMSFPYSAGQIPVYYNHYNTGRPKGAPDAQVRYVSQYLDSPNDPLFPFGFGLSYTTFQYSNLKLSKNQITKTDKLIVSFNVKNTGSVSGKEIVQLYISDTVGEVVRPVKELKGFKKIELDSNEEQTIYFELSEVDLRYFHSNLAYKSDPGTFIVSVGSSSTEVIELSFQLIPTKEDQ
ncbi:glycoside hydrolase family 3 N-terminal domain-containing protein [Gracilibacillus dipsosauri]|uniref:beta-glucosidase n=1 Tax=Gracilibacillus dipsosauri TaxID=178340 RepID=A0A317KTG3_9BACI|nr:glycoside hydrolase family 3 N-terminal domain-containing protein [Gracilibacillus dipsosauri]PWU66606.1 beta-glucosidase [Gracilibacillus dipsosauri]